MKKYYFLCLMLLGLSAFAFELSEPIGNALKSEQIKVIKEKENSIKEVKNEFTTTENNEKIVNKKVLSAREPSN